MWIGDECDELAEKIVQLISSQKESGRLSYTEIIELLEVVKRKVGVYARIDSTYRGESQ